METHPDPAKALSDGPNAVPLKHMKALLETLLELDRITKKNGFLENNFGLCLQRLHPRQRRRHIIATRAATKSTRSCPPSP
jgi:hypothetical protein